MTMTFVASDPDFKVTTFFDIDTSKALRYYYYYYYYYYKCTN